MIAQQYVHDHVMHFYHQHALDWVDVVSSLKQTRTNSPFSRAFNLAELIAGYFADAEEGTGDCDSGQLSIFANAYWVTLPTSFRLKLTAGCGTYLEALNWQRDATDSHDFWRQEPHPNFVVAAFPCH